MSDPNLDIEEGKAAYTLHETKEQTEDIYKATKSLTMNAIRDLFDLCAIVRDRNTEEFNFNAKVQEINSRFSWLPSLGGGLELMRCTKERGSLRMEGWR